MTIVTALPQSPIAVEVAVAIVVAAAAIVTPIGNAEHALDRAHRTANAGTDRAANHPADWTGNPAAFIRTLLRAADNALTVRGMRDREQGESE